MTRDYGIQAKGKHYASMVDLLGPAGRLTDAYDLFSQLYGVLYLELVKFMEIWTW